MDRVEATAFHEEKQVGADLVMSKWVANQLNRSKDFKKRNWKKKPLECFSDSLNCG